MNVQSQVRMDGAAFLAWAQGREGRYELAGGRLVMMTGGSRGHAIVSRRLSNALEQRLDEKRWAVLTSDFAVEIGANTIRYPDVVVDVVGSPWRDLKATAPAFIAEVLSPCSVTNDLGDKAAEYLRLGSVSAYVVLSQDEQKAWVWARGEAGLTVVAGDEGVIHIAELAIELPLAEIYRGFVPDEPKA